MRPQPAAVDLDRALALRVMGRDQEAMGLVAAALAADPDDLEALLLAATLRLDARDDEAALDLHQRAVRAWPGSAAAQNGLARCLHSLGRNAEALEVARSARRLLTEGENCRHTASVYLTLVWCLRDLRRYHEALDLAEEGLAKMPDAVLAEWATTLERELAEAQKERC
ncbi:MAG TPA: tetratricopeptide repeat protein [Vicinamibacteria bacterium]|nr:tetratricopeptide repeat protein [Vicinamibacteria bacterium]